MLVGLTLTVRISSPPATHCRCSAELHFCASTTAAALRFAVASAGPDASLHRQRYGASDETAEREFEG